MKIENGKIVSATENELFNEYLKKWCDFISFDEYIMRMKNAGVEVNDNGKTQK